MLGKDGILISRNTKPLTAQDHIRKKVFNKGFIKFFNFQTDKEIVEKVKELEADLNSSRKAETKNKGKSMMICIDNYSCKL